MHNNLLAEQKNIAPLAGKGKWLFSQECRFLLGATKTQHIKSWQYPEVAFVGGSNVGKSSIINAITNRKSLAKTSNTPGRTRQINFFLLAERLMLVDLPGYGYAKVSQKEKEKWADLINYYLFNRPQLKRVCLLIDSRHGLKDTDIMLLDALEEFKIPTQAIFTKSDKLNNQALKQLEIETEMLFNDWSNIYPLILLTSSAKRYGIDSMRGSLARVLY